MAKFLTGKELDEAISDVVFNAKKTLLIISPFIKLDKYFREIFDNHANSSDLQIIIAFGKNEKNVSLSFNKSDFEYFQKFPNISIIYVPNLHAKYYANETKGIITSINLYDYSFKNNVEYGVLFESNLFVGSKTDNEAWETSEKILSQNYAIFIRKPKFRRKVFGKDYIGSETQLDLTDDLLRNKKLSPKNYQDFESDDNLIDIIKPDKKPTREDFETTLKEKLHEELALSKNNNANSELNGYCIKCNTQIKLNPAYPYCITCYKKLGTYHKETHLEKFCHSCGELNKVSQVKPVCPRCFAIKESRVSNKRS